jgi:hypothetical protein
VIKKKKKKMDDRPAVSRMTIKATGELREHYDMGVRAIQETLTKDGKAKYRAAAVGNLARRAGTSRTIVYDARQFAARYTPSDVDELIEQCEKHDVGIAPSHVFELMRILDPKERSLVQEKAIRGRWPVKTLQQEVRARNRAM